MVELVDRWCASNPDADVFGQLPNPGRAGYKPRHFSWMTFLHPDEYHQMMRDASFVVAHAGMGSIITALCLSKPIVIFPRRAALKEQRNDHQLATARRLASRPGVWVAFEGAELLDTLDRLHAGAAEIAASPLDAFPDPAFTDRLRMAILAGGRSGVPSGAFGAGSLLRPGAASDARRS